MRNWKFILSTAAILLAGAAAAGLIAHAVVAPQMGKIQSAGVVTIPTVLGQTAEEVLFYPWSMYDTQPLHRLTEDELLHILGLEVLGATMEEVNQVLLEADDINDAGNGTILLLFTNFELIMPLSIQWDSLITALEWNLDKGGGAPAAGPQMFLKDFPALARREDQVPVTLSFATGGDGSLSFLIRPARAGTLTGEEQAAALEQVANDLLALFSAAAYAAEMPGSETGELSDENAGIDYAAGLALRRLIQTFFDYNYRSGIDSVKPISDFLADRFWMADNMALIAPEAFGPDSIDEFLSAVETAIGWNIQIVTTQQQILVLFTQSGGAVFGVYYDIQLGCYSGIGVSQ